MEPQRRSDPGFGSGPPKYPGTFLLAFREAAASVNLQIRRWLGHSVACVDAEGREQTVGLENLYRRARQVERADWPEMIANFLKSVDLDKIKGQLGAELEQIADQVLVRLGKGVPKEMGAWEQSLEGTDLAVNLVVDYPNRMVYVTREQVEKSGKPGEHWLKRAVANLLERTPEECLEVVDEESGILLGNVEDAYDATRALLLEDLLPQAKEEGYFVGLPSRDQLFVLPVVKEAVVFLYLMKGIVDKEFQTRPYPISRELYWVRGGAWHVFPVEVDLVNKRLSLSPPPDLVPILDRFLAEDDQASGGRESPGEEEGPEPPGEGPEPRED
jgi:hypothetical protein